MRSPFLDRLHQGPIIADGAIGTQLHERGVRWGRSLDAVTLDDRAMLLRLHVDYLQAGAGILTTNTFSANRVRLADFDLDQRVRELNIAAVKTAREAREIVGAGSFVAGAIGPVSRPGRLAATAAVRRTLQDAFVEQALALAEGGADIFMLETFTDLVEVELAIAACRSAGDLPVVACMSFDADGRTAREAAAPDVARALAEFGADVVGINCAVGPLLALDVASAMIDEGVGPVAVLPNAGLPTRRGHSFLYRSTPSYFAEYAAKFIAAGAAIVGGCCGTGPEHIAAMTTALGTVVPDADSASALRAEIRVRSYLPEPEGGAADVPTHPPTAFQAALDAHEFVVSVEMAPPKGINPDKLIGDAKLLEAAGLRFVNITDSAMARVRMSATAVAQLIQAHTSLEAIIHYTTRDRNLMALQSELIGAHALGVRNVLALTGDPPGIGDYPDATGVWDVESMGLIDVVGQLNRGRDAHGRVIGDPAAFCVGCAVNPTAEDLDLELARLQQKLDAGAQFIMSQPLYDVAAVQQFIQRAGDLRAPFLLGVLPVQSARHAEYLHNEVPGIVIPEHVREAMRDAEPAESVATGVALARQLIAEAREFVDGVYLMPSFGRYEVCAQVLDALEFGVRS